MLMKSTPCPLSLSIESIHNHPSHIEVVGLQPRRWPRQQLLSKDVYNYDSDSSVLLYSMVRQQQCVPYCLLRSQIQDCSENLKCSERPGVKSRNGGCDVRAYHEPFRLRSEKNFVVRKKVVQRCRRRRRTTEKSSLTCLKVDKSFSPKLFFCRVIPSHMLQVHLPYLAFLVQIKSSKLLKNVSRIWINKAR